MMCSSSSSTVSVTATMAYVTDKQKFTPAGDQQPDVLLPARETDGGSGPTAAS